MNTLLSAPPPKVLSQQWEEVPILKKTIDLYTAYYRYLEVFPKKDKYALGARCERLMIEVIELLLETSYLPKEAKRATLLKANTKFETLKVLIRLLNNLKILEQKKYIVLQGSLQEIGRMLGGWIKSV